MDDYNLSIQLENTTAVFYPGQTINGKVNVTAFKRLSCKLISLRVYGEAVAYHKEDEVDSNKVSKEIYFNSTFILWAPLNSKTKLPMGKTDFNFTFPLPMNLPSSFEAKNGHVRYQCEANLERNRKKGRKCLCMFTMNPTLDLNAIPSAKQKVESQHHKHLHNMLLKKVGEISAKVSIDKSGYVPGESIIVNATVCADAIKSITKTKAALVMRCRYSSRGGLIKRKTLLSEVDRGYISPGQIYNWQNVAVNIPPCPPSELGGNCSIISVTYYVLFTVVPEGLSLNLEIKLPIVIGNIPLYTKRLTAQPQTEPQSRLQNASNPPPVPPRPSVQRFAGAEGGASNDLPPKYEPPPADPQSAYPDMPPPSYEESLNDRVVISNRSDDVTEMLETYTFAPRYTVYRRPQ